MSPVHRFTLKILDEFQNKSGYKISELLRVRTNLITKFKGKEEIYTRPHWDTYTEEGDDKDFHVLIYYVNDSLGANVGTIEADDVVLVGTLPTFDLDTLTVANFLFA
jgi:hypothetical protein